MTAGILRLCDIAMGTLIDPDNQEDQEFLTHGGDFQFLMDKKRSRGFIGGVSGIIEQRNTDFDVWGWKDPLSILYIERVLGRLRNPHFIFVTRDVVATAMRERVEAVDTFGEPESSLSFFSRKLSFASDLYSRSIEFLLNSPHPALFVSYERSLRYRKNLADLILDFCDLDNQHHGEAQEKIVAYISPDRLTGSLSAREPAGHYDYLDDKSLLVACASYTDVYSEAATLVNSRRFADALSVCSLFEHVFDEGERVSLFRVPDVDQTYDLFIASRFICALAYLNLGKARKAVKVLSLFNSLFDTYRATRKLPVSASVANDASELLKKIL